MDALASCGSSIEVLQDEFGKLSSSVRTDFDSHKEEQVKTYLDKINFHDIMYSLTN